MGDTSIEWTEKTWNPLRGCSRVSPGCGGPNSQGGCYAEKIAARFSDPGQPFHGYAVRTKAGGRWTGKVALLPEKLTEPFTWRAPARVFTNSMSDIFHEALPNEEIAAIFGVMAACPQHTFQLLTKRAHRMRQWFEWLPSHYRGPRKIPVWASDDLRRRLSAAPETEWPLPNVWLGVSVEDQQRADERITDLVQTPAAVRFLSCEPLLGPVQLSWPSVGCEECELAETKCDEDGCCLYCGADVPRATQPSVDWVIVGGESGPKSRRCDISWIRSVVEQCRQAEVPCFVKQLGANVYRSSGSSLCRECADSGPVCPNDGLPCAGLTDKKGGDPAEWPADLRIREFPTP